jgi:hypothetical protein
LKIKSFPLFFKTQRGLSLGFLVICGTSLSFYQNCSGNKVSSNIAATASKVSGCEACIGTTLVPPNGNPTVVMGPMATGAGNSSSLPQCVVPDSAHLAALTGSGGNMIRTGISSNFNWTDMDTVSIGTVGSAASPVNGSAQALSLSMADFHGIFLLTAQQAGNLQTGSGYLSLLAASIQTVSSVQNVCLSVLQSAQTVENVSGDLVIMGPTSGPLAQIGVVQSVAGKLTLENVHVLSLHKVTNPTNVECHNSVIDSNEDGVQIDCSH